MSVNCKYVEILVFLIQILTFSGSCGFHLCNVDEVTKFVNSLIVEFEKDYSNERFHSVILPPISPVGKTQAEFLLPKVLLWSPKEQYNCHINCPVHNTPMKPWQWTSDLSGKKGKRPRLIYDLFGNIILVQRLYICIRGRKTHKVTATSPDLMSTLPAWLQNTFPIRLFQRSGCSKKLLEYVTSAVTQGVNFLKISENIACLNHGEHTKLGLTYNNAREDDSTPREPYDFNDFYTNDIFAFPSNDQLMNIILSQYQLDKDNYISEMQKVTGKAISCDHTFKVSRNIGVVTEGSEDRFLKQFSNLYIVLNEHGEICDWRLTKTTAFDEIEDLLIDLRDRLSLQEQGIETICIDDCCKNRQKYEGIFPNCKVKLDIFHACQRVIRCLPNKHILKSQFAKEFGLIFREKDDLGEQRLKNTPNECTIEQNLDSLLKKWKSFPGTCLTEDSLKQIEALRAHIRKGCVSDIPPGFGTEKNEQLHRLLNRSLLSGATRINIELAVALLTILFYYHSKRVTSNRKHSCNAKIQCVPPVERHANLSTDNEPTTWAPFKVREKEEGPIEPRVCREFDTESFATIDDVCSEKVAEGILKAAQGIYDIISSLTEDVLDRSFNADDLLLLNNIPTGLTMRYTEEIEDENDECDPTVVEHVQSLSRNLGGFNLTTDPVPKDGDCAFRSTARMLSSVCDPQQPEISTYLNSIGLCKSEDQDTITLRNLFVDEILKCDEEILAFFPEQSKEEITTKALQFRRQGVFDTAIGDLVMRVCAQLLRLPVMVVTSLNSLPCVPFIPTNPLSSRPIYVAFHYYGAGHYDSTRSLGARNKNESDEECQPAKVTGCSCGSKEKLRNKEACTNKGGKSRCPCVKRGQACDRDLCKCRSCANVDEKSTEKKSTQCRCGEAKKGRCHGNEEQTVSCIDVTGRNRTKCPCFNAGSGCKDCKCYNCENSFGKNTTDTPAKGDGQEKKRKSALSTPPSLKRRRGTEYLRENKIENIAAGWSQLENCVLEMTENFISASNLEQTKKNICTLYNFVIESDFAKCNSFRFNGRKTLSQIHGKLAYINRRTDAIWSLASGRSNS